MADTKDASVSPENAREKPEVKSEVEDSQSETLNQPSEEPTSTEPEEKKEGSDAASSIKDRQARFKALQARAVSAIPLDSYVIYSILIGRS